MSKELLQLDFAGLMELDERKVARLLLLHLNHVAQDIYNRPHEMGKRKVLLEITFAPKKSINNEPTDRVNCSIDCKTKTPIWRTNEYDMRLSKKALGNGSTQFGFQFSNAFADNLDANPLPFENDQGE